MNSLQSWLASTLLPVMLRVAKQARRYSLLQRFEGIGQCVLLRFAEQEVNMVEHYDIAINVDGVATPHAFPG